GNLGDRYALSAGDIAEVLRQLGVPMAQENVSKLLRQRGAIGDDRVRGSEAISAHSARSDSHGGSSVGDLPRGRCRQKRGTGDPINRFEAGARRIELTA